jgi:hypothetical protein
MALTKISRGLLNTGISDSSDATAITIDSSENSTFAGTVKVNGAGNTLELNASSGVTYQKFSENGTGRFFLATLNGADGLAFVDADGSAERMRIDSSGNVGIGTSSPNGKLTISNSGAGGFEFTPDTTAFSVANSNYIASYDRSASAYRDIVFDLGGAENQSIRFKAGGNVGIGTSSPSSYDFNDPAKLVVANTSGNSTLSIVSGTTSIGYLAFADGTSGTARYPGSLQYNHNSNYMSFHTNDGSERMRITSAGGVGINTTSVTGPLTVQELSSQVIRSESTGSGTVTHLQFVKTSGGAAQIGSITGTTSSVSYNTTSDYRLKENVITDWNATTLLKQLKPSKFNFKDNQSETVTGFIAHEIQEILPYLVSGEKDGEDMQSMDYAKLTPLLTKAIQEQQTQIEALQSEINTLKGGD